MITSLEFIEVEPGELDEIFCAGFWEDEDVTFKYDDPKKCAHCGNCSKSGHARDI